MSDSSSSSFYTLRGRELFGNMKRTVKGVIGNYCVCVCVYAPSAIDSQSWSRPKLLLCDTCIYSLGRKGHGIGPLVNVLKRERRISFPLCQREFQIIRQKLFFYSFLSFNAWLYYQIEWKKRKKNKRWRGDDGKSIDLYSISGRRQTQVDPC